MSLITKVLSTVAGPLFDLIDKNIQDKDEAARLKQVIQSQVLDNKASDTQARMKIVLAEAQGESWMQRNWRPSLMMTIVAIVAYNFLLSPLLSQLFGLDTEALALPDQLWNLMLVGVGGYIGGRTYEKVRGATTSAPNRGLYDDIDTKE